jgi:hypothetical protein
MERRWYQPSVAGDEDGGKHVLVDEEVAHPVEERETTVRRKGQRPRMELSRTDEPLRDDDIDTINALREVDFLHLALNERNHCRDMFDLIF